MSTLLHVIFENKDYQGVGIPLDTYFHKFLKTNPPDGISCFETSIGHGKNIKKASHAMKDSRQTRDIEKNKTGERYSDFAYLEFQENQFHEHFDPMNNSILKNCGAADIFYFDCSQRHNGNPTHVIVRLADGLSVRRDGSFLTGLNYNGHVIADDTAINKIFLGLKRFFQNKKITKETCQDKGYFDDCNKIDRDIICPNSC